MASAKLGGASGAGSGGVNKFIAVEEDPNGTLEGEPGDIAYTDAQGWFNIGGTDWLPVGEDLLALIAGSAELQLLITNYVAIMQAGQAIRGTALVGDPLGLWAGQYCRLGSDGKAYAADGTSKTGVTAILGTVVADAANNTMVTYQRVGIQYVQAETGCTPTIGGRAYCSGEQMGKVAASVNAAYQDNLTVVGIFLQNAVGGDGKVAVLVQLPAGSPRTQRLTFANETDKTFSDLSARKRYRYYLTVAGTGTLYVQPNASDANCRSTRIITTITQYDYLYGGTATASPTPMSGQIGPRVNGGSTFRAEYAGYAVCGMAGGGTTTDYTSLRFHFTAAVTGEVLLIEDEG